MFTGDLYITLSQLGASKIVYPLLSALKAQDSVVPVLTSISSTVSDINERPLLTLLQVEALKAQVETLDLAYDSRKTNQLVPEMDKRLVELESSL